MSSAFLIIASNLLRRMDISCNGVIALFVVKYLEILLAHLFATLNRLGVAH